VKYFQTTGKCLWLERVILVVYTVTGQNCNFAGFLECQGEI